MDHSRLRIEDHARTCQRQAIPAEGVVRQYQVLRELLGQRLQQALPAETVRPSCRG